MLSSLPTPGQLTPEQAAKVCALSVNTPADITAVIRQLIDITARAQDPIGYFAALYLHVSLAFEEALRDGTFDHPVHMARLDVVFFRRYLVALQRYLCRGAPSLCWQLSFDASRDPKPIVLQHLLLGMNAHINYDLGVATFDAFRGLVLDDLRPDFDRMNALLASLLSCIMADLTQVWPWLAIINRAFGPIDDTLINFAMRQARDQAWGLAVSLSQSSPTGQRQTLDRLQVRVSGLADTLWQPGCMLSVPLALVRASERGDPAEIIHTLAHANAS
jgi:hypothetical protein